MEEIINSYWKDTFREIVKEGKSQQLIESLFRDPTLNPKVTLTPKEEIVIRMYFGIGIDRPYTVEEIAKYLSLTEEQVRRIGIRANKKLMYCPENWLRRPKRIKN